MHLIVTTVIYIINFPSVPYIYRIWNWVDEARLWGGVCWPCTICGEGETNPLSCTPVLSVWKAFEGGSCSPAHVTLQSRGGQKPTNCPSECVVQRRTREQLWGSVLNSTSLQSFNRWDICTAFKDGCYRYNIYIFLKNVYIFTFVWLIFININILMKNLRFNLI